MNRNPMIHRLRLAVTVLALGAAACQQDRLGLPKVEVSPSLVVGLEASSLDASAGSRVAVAVRAEAEHGLVAGLQGTLRFDPARLEYVGQSEEGVLTVVNDAAAAQGVLRLASLNVGGLPTRTAVVVFAVRSSDYARGLRYDLEEAAAVDAEPVTDVRRASGVLSTGALPVPPASKQTAEQVVRRLYPSEPVVQAVPGQYLLNLRFGDANLSGTVTIGDAADVANTAVGNNPIIVGTNAPARDRVVAANVRPANLPGLGEPGDALAPGVEANGTRAITIGDAVAVANEAVGNDQTIAGDLVPGRGPVATNRVIITGNITADQTFTRDNVYELQGIVTVTNGATLTIEAGTVVEGLTGAAASALFIDRNGRIIADGTPLQPITFTCTGPKAKGCWGGLWIAGSAPINNLTGALVTTSPVIPGRAPTGGCFENVGEGGATLYGGCNPDDSSGVLRYVIAEFGGRIVSGANELNDVTMGGVGRRTVVDHIQVARGLDDGLELFGGTVNIRHLYAIGNSDDSFDTCCGWSGSSQFVIIQHDSVDSDKGFEVDNTEVAATYETGPFTTAQHFNVTFVGRQDPTGGAAAGNQSNDAFHLRRGTSESIRNALVINARSNLDIDDQASCTETAGEGTVSIQSSLFAGYGVLGNADAGADEPTSCPTSGGPATATATGNIEANVITLSGNQTFVSSTGILISPFNTLIPDFRPASILPAGVSLVGATPPSNGFFDVTATFIGAVPQANATGSNIPWYSGWTKGY